MCSTVFWEWSLNAHTILDVWKHTRFVWDFPNFAIICWSLWCQPDSKYVSLNIYINWIYIFLTRCSIRLNWFFLPDIQFHLYLRAPPTPKKIFLCGPEQRNHELLIYLTKRVFLSLMVDIYQSEIANGLKATTMYKIYKIRHSPNTGSKHDWLANTLEYISLLMMKNIFADVKNRVQD